MTLLKNDNVLPLSLDAPLTIAVIGPNADNTRCLVGNYNGTSSRFVTFLSGLRAACEGKARVLYAQGAPLWLTRTGYEQGAGECFAEAVSLAKEADVVICCVGLDETLEGEEGAMGSLYNGDRGDLELPDVQNRLLDALAACGKPLVTVVAAGSALRVEQGDAILYAWYPGQAGGTALADILFGRVSPSGRLPVTFYRDLSDLPAFEEYAMENRTYRYYNGEPLYPFGYGLSYAHFTYQDIQYDAGKITFTLINESELPAEEVAQVYVKPVDCPFAPPHPKLCAFARVSLAAHERRSVTLPLDPDAFTAVNDEGERVASGCQQDLYLGGSQPDNRSLALTGRTVNSLRVTIQ